MKINMLGKGLFTLIDEAGLKLFKLMQESGATESQLNLLEVRIYNSIVLKKEEGFCVKGTGKYEGKHILHVFANTSPDPMNFDYKHVRTIICENEGDCYKHNFEGIRDNKFEVVDFNEEPFIMIA